LSASLVVALVFTPTLGALLGKATPLHEVKRAARDGFYMRTVKLTLRRPGAAPRRGRRRGESRAASRGMKAISACCSPRRPSTRSCRSSPGGADAAARGCTAAIRRRAAIR